MTKAEIEAAVKKYGSQRKAAKALGFGSVRSMLRGARPKSAATDEARIGKSLQEFRAAHDKNFIVPNKIRAALKNLGSGWEYEAAFIRLAGISQSDMGNFREQFSEHIVLVDRTKRVWAGTKATAAALREMVS